MYDDDPSCATHTGRTSGYTTRTCFHVFEVGLPVHYELFVWELWRPYDLWNPVTYLFTLWKRRFPCVRDLLDKIVSLLSYSSRYTTLYSVIRMSPTGLTDSGVGLSLHRRKTNPTVTLTSKGPDDTWYLVQQVTCTTGRPPITYDIRSGTRKTSQYVRSSRRVQ